MQGLTPLEQTVQWVSWSMVAFNERLELIGNYTYVQSHPYSQAQALTFRALDDWPPASLDLAERVIRDAEIDYRNGCGISRRATEPVDSFKRRVHYYYMYHKRYFDHQYIRGFAPHPLASLME
jgi:hypothetical protein